MYEMYETYLKCMKWYVCYRSLRAARGTGGCPEGAPEVTPNVGAQIVPEYPPGSILGHPADDVRLGGGWPRLHEGGRGPEPLAFGLWSSDPLLPGFAASSGGGAGGSRSKGAQLVLAR